MVKKKSILDLYEMKKKREVASWVTAYDYPFASFAEKAGIDLILVGDSLGMVVKGYKGTEKVTMEDCISHAQDVRRGAPNTFCIGDLPFMSYQVSIEQATINAGRLIKEAEMDAVKLEGGRNMADRIKAISNAGILVFGHIGLTPQSSGQLGGFKAQGKNISSAKEIIKDALAVQEAGAHVLLVEAVPPEVTSFLVERLAIPVYGAGAGLCDGQCLISADLLGLFQAFTPKFSKKYLDLAGLSIKAFEEFHEDVKERRFPSREHTYQSQASPEELQELFSTFT